MQQLAFLNAVLNTYAESDKPINNKTLYQSVAKRLNLTTDNTNSKTTPDKSGQEYNLFYRTVRWVQQSLKQKKLITNVSRGCWEIHKEKKKELTAITPEKNVLAISTNLGIVLWTKNTKAITDMIEGEFHAMITSPPYPLRSARAYGNPDIQAYVDFICEALEPILPKLASGGSIVLNVSNDIFMSKSPARSTYYYRLVIALEERLGLHLMDDIPWSSNKIPGPVQWASKTRQQLNYGYEHCLWLTNDPVNCFADNRRVLIPHTEKHQKFISDGGNKKHHVNGDGAYIKPIGAFSTQTLGTIPKNVLNIPNNCKEGRAVQKFAKENGIIPHAAKMPLTLAEFFVKFLTRPDDLIIDLFAGTLTTGQAAQNNGRRFIMLEMMLEYICQGFHRFRNTSSTWINPNLFNTNIAKPCY